MRDKRYFPESARRSVTFQQIVEEAEEATQKAHQLKYGDKRRFRDYRWGILKQWFTGRAAASITGRGDRREAQRALQDRCDQEPIPGGLVQGL
jgi:hypothetical protein